VMEDCSTDERLQQEMLCRRQWTDEYIERPETLIRQKIVVVWIYVLLSPRHNIRTHRSVSCAGRTASTDDFYSQVTFYSWVYTTNWAYCKPMVINTIRTVGPRKTEHKWKISVPK